MLKKISARHFDLTDEMKEKAESELDALTRYFENIISAEFVLDIGGTEEQAAALGQVSQQELGAAGLGQEGLGSGVPGPPGEGVTSLV